MCSSDLFPSHDTGAGGGGSATVSAGGSPSGGGYQQTDNAGMGLQAGLNAMQTEAQIELLKAQALKEKASAEIWEQTQIQLTKAEIY